MADLLVYSERTETARELLAAGRKLARELGLGRGAGRPGFDDRRLERWSGPCRASRLPVLGVPAVERGRMGATGVARSPMRSCESSREAQVPTGPSNRSTAVPFSRARVATRQRP